MRANERKEESRGLGSPRISEESRGLGSPRISEESRGLDSPRISGFFLLFPKAFDVKDTFEKESANVLKQNSSFYCHRSLGTGKQCRSLVPRACRVGTPDRL